MHKYNTPTPAPQDWPRLTNAAMPCQRPRPRKPRWHEVREGLPIVLLAGCTYFLIFLMAFGLLRGGE